MAYRLPEVFGNDSANSITVDYEKVYYGLKGNDTLVGSPVEQAVVIGGSGSDRYVVPASLNVYSYLNVYDGDPSSTGSDTLVALPSA